MFVRACMLAGLALAVSGPGAAHAAGAGDGGAVGVIALDPGANTITITGKAVAVVDGHYDAVMTVRKSGKAGTTDTTQKGSFDLAAGESADVARMGVSYVSGDDLSVELTISQDDLVIWKTSSASEAE